MSQEEESEEPRSSWIELAGGPLMLWIFALAMLLGAGLGWHSLSDDWSVLRRVVGGAFMGLCCALMVWANRALGSWS